MSWVGVGGRDHMGPPDRPQKRGGNEEPGRNGAGRGGGGGARGGERAAPAASAGAASAATGAATASAAGRAAGAPPSAAAGVDGPHPIAPRLRPPLRPPAPPLFPFTRTRHSAPDTFAPEPPSPGGPGGASRVGEENLVSSLGFLPGAPESGARLLLPGRRVTFTAVRGPLQGASAPRRRKPWNWRRSCWAARCAQRRRRSPPAAASPAHSGPARARAS